MEGKLKETTEERMKEVTRTRGDGSDNGDERGDREGRRGKWLWRRMRHRKFCCFNLLGNPISAHCIIL
ncbi:zinc finger protein [Sesbania bispinosa]|nr:zinc finger protein [Sesbania bispinosa]